MKLGLLSDIHVDLNLTGDSDRIVPAMADYAKNCHLDAWLIAGDLASDHELSLEAVKTLEKLSSRPVFFTPGNHDIWIEKHPDLDSWENYRRLASHPGNLAGGNIRIKDGWTLAGDLGWYDFSFGDPKYSLEDFTRMVYLPQGPGETERVWMDSYMAVWHQSCLETHGWFLDRLKERLDEASRTPGENIIVLTHVLPIDDFTVTEEDHPYYRMWRYLNAFLGGHSYGELFFKYPGIKYSVCGHIHYRMKVRHKHINFYCSCLGYTREWQNPEDPYKEIEISTAILEI